MSTGYAFDQADFARLLIAKSYPEKTDHESALLRDYLVARLHEYDRVEFSARIGDGLTPDPTHLPAIQKNTEAFTKKRVDMIGYFGQQVTLVEAKTTLSHQVLGQLLSDRAIWMSQYPDAPEPRMVAIGRRGTAQDLAILAAHGIDAYLYAPATAER